MTTKLAAPQIVDELREARAAWHDEAGVPINPKYARFLTAIGELEDFAVELTGAESGENTRLRAEAFLRTFYPNIQGRWEFLVPVLADFAERERERIARVGAQEENTQ